MSRDEIRVEIAAADAALDAATTRHATATKPIQAVLTTWHHRLHEANAELESAASEHRQRLAALKRASRRDVAAAAR